MRREQCFLYKHPYSPSDFPVRFAGPAVTRLGSAELLEFFFKQKQLNYRNEAWDLFWWSANKMWFCIPVKSSDAVSSCWRFQVLLPSVAIPVDALASKGKPCFSAGLECPSVGVERDAGCCSKLFPLWCLSYKSLPSFLKASSATWTRLYFMRLIIFILMFIFWK